MQLEVNHHIIKMPLTVFSVWYIKHSISYSQCSLSQTRQERREQQERENKIVRERQQEKEGDGRTQKRTQIDELYLFFVYKKNISYSSFRRGGWGGVGR